MHGFPYCGVTVSTINDYTILQTIQSAQSVIIFSVTHLILMGQFSMKIVDPGIDLFPVHIFHEIKWLDEKRVSEYRL